MKRARSSSSSKASKFKKTSSNKSLTVYKQPTNPIRFVKRHVDYFTINVSNITGAAGAFNFALNSVPGNSELVSMYDQYKISAVGITFYPKQNVSGRCDTLDITKGCARILTCIDYNDDTPPTSADQIREYENCQVSSVLEKHEVYVKEPLFLNNSGQNVNGWVSTANPSTRFYGCKFFIEPSLMTGVNSYQYTVECIFYMAFKNVK